MKHFFSLCLACVAITVSAADKTPWKLVDAQDLRVINQGFDNLQRTYDRFPAYLEDSCRQEQWQGSQCSAGIAVRFATDSKRIGVKYQLLRNFHMVHMADTGTKGSDLYIWDENFDNLDTYDRYEQPGFWMHVNGIRPYVNNDSDKIVEKTYVENLDGQMHEYMIYFPLYDGVEQLWVKVDSGATITPGSLELIEPQRRIVAYGTSIMQGGCASRTGMASSNILSRRLNREVINVGISGQAKLDTYVARALTEIPDVDIYLIDPVPNCTELMCDTLTYDFVKIIRDARPEAKIVMVEGPLYPYHRYDSYTGKYLPSKNANFRKNYERLKAENPDNIYYVTCDNLDGIEDDGTVDAIHLTDLGFLHYADKLAPVLAPLLTK